MIKLTDWLNGRSPRLAIDFLRIGVAEALGGEVGWLGELIIASDATEEDALTPRRLRGGGFGAGVLEFISMVAELSGSPEALPFTSCKF